MDDHKIEKLSKLQLEKLPEVEIRTSLKKSYIYAKVKMGEFPKPIRLGRRTVAWVSEEITKWIQDRISISRSHD